MSDAGESWRVALRAKSLARFVELKLEGVDAVWSDNYFDLPAGRERVVTCAKADGQTLEGVRAGLRVRSLWDSF